MRDPETLSASVFGRDRPHRTEVRSRRRRAAPPVLAPSEKISRETVLPRPEYDRVQFLRQPGSQCTSASSPTTVRPRCPSLPSPAGLLPTIFLIQSLPLDEDACLGADCLIVRQLFEVAWRSSALALPRQVFRSQKSDRPAWRHSAGRLFHSSPRREH